MPPIAIVGIGCRFPGGATTPAKFWQILVDEVLRWNKNFSLVSRQNPEERTQALVDECWASLQAFVPELLRLATLPDASRDILADLYALDQPYGGAGVGCAK